MEENGERARSARSLASDRSSRTGDAISVAANARTLQEQDTAEDIKLRNQLLAEVRRFVNERLIP